MKCPQCGATLKPETRGKLRDKFATCEHCGYQTDVPDSFTFEETEEVEPYIDAEGRTVRRRVTRRYARSDGPLDLEDWRVGPGDDFEQIIGEMRRHAGDDIADVLEEALREAPGDVHEFHFESVDNTVQITDTRRSPTPPTQADEKTSPALAILVGGGVVLLLCMVLALIIVVSGA